MITKSQQEIIKKWEYKNMVYGKGYVDNSKGMGKSLSDNMQRRGYDVMRVSPGMTTKFGLKYRKVYGGEVSPNYNMSKKGEKYYPKVTWHMQGYIKAGKSKGTTMLNRQSLLQNFKKTELKRQLMMK